jgi:hypothetical protein
MSLFQHEDEPRDNRAHMSLQGTEQALLAAASRIYAARIAAGLWSPEKDKEEIQGAIRKAIQMGKIIDDVVRAENEM